METKEEDNSETSKNQEIEVKGEIVEVTKTKRNNKQMKLKGPTFEIKEYAFF